MESNRQQKSKSVQWVILWALGIWGILSFLVLAGDENPDNPVSLNEFLLIKAAGVASLLLCCLVGKRLYRGGYLPDELDEEV